MAVEPWIVPIVVVVCGIAFYLAQRYGWIDLSNKSKSSGTHGGALGMGDEVFAPSRYEAQLELDRQTVLPAPAPLPGDGDQSIGSRGAGVYSGQVRIDLAAKHGERAANPQGEE
jgi:hypothetical protein